MKTTHERFDEKRKYPQEMLLMGGCPNCGQETNIKFIEDVVDRIIALAVAEERKRIVEKIIKEFIPKSYNNQPIYSELEVYLKNNNE